jgi:hypothetical protein
MDIAINVKNISGSILGTLDLGDADLNMVFQLSDVTEPQKRKANYIRKFTIPGTKQNNQIFNGIFEQGYSVHLFNPSKKLFAQVLFNGNISFEGSLQLNKIIKNDDNQKIGYEITIYGSLADFFNDIKDADLSQIDISEYNHDFNRENIMASWATSIPCFTKNFGPGVSATTNQYTAKVQPGFIWKNGVKQPFVLGEGYVYPFINKGQTEMKLSATTLDWTPAVYVRTIMRKIFDKYGWKWRSRFFDTDTFRSLIIPFGKDRVTDDFYASLTSVANTQELTQFIVNIGTPANPGIEISPQMSPQVVWTRNNNLIKFTNDTVEPGKDPSNLYDPTTGFFTPTKTFKYALFTNVIIGLEMVPSSFVTINYVGENIPVTLKLCDVTDWNPSGAPIQTLGVTTLGQGTVKVLGSTTTTFKTNGKSYGYGGVESNTMFVKFEGELVKGRKYAVLVDWSIPAGKFKSGFTNQSTGASIGGAIKMYVGGGQPYPTQTESSRFYANILDQTVEFGQTINMNKVLDSSVKITDFIVGINNLFNLYWKPTGNDREFIIEPRDTFYNTSNVKDWTDKINNSDDVTIEPLYEMTANKYLFQYREDSDYLNDDYQIAFTETHGTKRIEVDNDFIDNEETITTIFSPSPQYQFAGTDIVSPAFIKLDGTKYSNTGVKTRILFYGGLVATKRNKVSTLIEFSIPKPLYVTTLQETPILYLDKYPYSGHNDRPFDPSQTLEYGLSKKLYYDLRDLNGTITNNNLFNVYWRNQMLEVTNPDGHLLTATCILSSLDIQNMDLTATIVVNFVKYRINKITYNPFTYVAEVQLIKKLDTASFTPAYMTYTDIIGWKPNPESPVSVKTGGVSAWKPYKGAYSSANEAFIPALWSVPYQNPIKNINQWGFTRYDVWTESITTPLFSPVTAPSTPYQWSIPTKPNTFVDTPPNPSFSLFDTSTSNVFYRQQNQIVQGQNNIIAPGVTEVAVRGSSNTVSSGSRKIAITGDNNTVAPNLENVTIVGSNHIVTESNVSFIQGVLLKDGRVQNVELPLISGNNCLTSSGVISGGINNVLIGSKVISSINRS